MRMRQPRPRASDAQRTAVGTFLDDAFAAGKLDRFEHFERIRTATRAKFVDELQPLVGDLRGGDSDLGLVAVGSESATDPGPGAGDGSRVHGDP